MGARRVTVVGRLGEKGRFFFLPMGPLPLWPTKSTRPSLSISPAARHAQPASAPPVSQAGWNTPAGRGPPRAGLGSTAIASSSGDCAAHGATAQTPAMPSTISAAARNTDVLHADSSRWRATRLRPGTEQAPFDCTTSGSCARNQPSGPRRASVQRVVFPRQVASALPIRRTYLTSTWAAPRSIRSTVAMPNRRTRHVRLLLHRLMYKCDLRTSK
jgi:hypothetical protein